MMNRLQTNVLFLVGIAVSWWLLAQMLDLFGRFADVLAIFGFAWMLNLLLEPLVEQLSRWVPRPYAWASGYLILLLLLGVLSIPLATQASALPATVPGVIDRTTQQIDGFLTWLRSHRITVPASTQRVLESSSLPEQIGPTVLAWSLALLSVGGQFLLVIGVAAAMSAGDDSLRAILRAALPVRWHAEAQRIYHDVRRTYSAAIRGQMAIWALGMSLSLGTLAFAGVPAWLIWIGPLALIRLLPYIGGVVAGALTVAVLLLSLPWPQSLAPIVIFLIGQNLMGYVIEPILLGRVLKLSPGLILFVVLAGWNLGGVTGIVFGVPAVAVVQALAERVISGREGQPPADVAPTVPADAAVAPVAGTVVRRSQ